MEIIINDTNMNEEKITNIIEKVIALIITEDNKILIANYAGIPLLPGGKIDNNELPEEALVRELEEELGINYKKDDLKYFLRVKAYQENYPSRDGNICNRKLITDYYLAPYKKIEVNRQKLTEHEKNNNFYLELLTIEELKTKLNKLNNDNPRNIYFKKELNIILENYFKNH